jgi:hypothetical protein
MRFVGKGVCVPGVQKRKKLGEKSIHKAKDNRRYRSQLFLRIALQSIAYRFAFLQCMRAQERVVLFCSHGQDQQTCCVCRWESGSE